MEAKAAGKAPPKPAQPAAQPVAQPAQPQQPQQPQKQQPQQQQQSQDKSALDAKHSVAAAATAGDRAVQVDYTTIPTQLEKKYEELDVDGALRPTIINAGNYWTKKSQKSLLAEPATAGMGTNEQGKERSKAFDLLDALTKSGDLSIEHAALHVVIAATHCFDKTLVNTVIQDNVNPIEKVERSSLIVATTIHGVSAPQLLAAGQIERVTLYSPMLIEAADDSLVIVNKDTPK
jgi:hypothetical protein